MLQCNIMLLHLTTPVYSAPALISPRAPLNVGVAQQRLSDRVLGITINGESRASPIRLLNWREMVNDTVSGKPIVSTECPLYGTEMVLDAMVNGGRFEFGLHGLL